MSSALKVARVLVYTCRECDRRLGIKRCQTGHLEKVLTFEGPREASSFGITPCKPKFLVGRVDGCFLHACPTPCEHKLPLHLANQSF